MDGAARRPGEDVELTLDLHPADLRGILQSGSAERRLDQLCRDRELDFVEIEQIGVEILIDQIQLNRLRPRYGLPLKEALLAHEPPFVDVAGIVWVLGLERDLVGRDRDLQRPHLPAAELLLDRAHRLLDRLSSSNRVAASVTLAAASIAAPASIGTDQRTQRKTGNEAGVSA